MSAPTYTELLARRAQEPARVGGKAEFIASLDAPTRKAWKVIDVLLDRRGFDFDGLYDEIQDEIFEEIRNTIAEP